MQPPRLADTAERDYFTPQREADHYAKTTEGTQKYINDSVDRVAHIDGQLMQLLWVYMMASSEYNVSNKTEQSIYECLLGFSF